MNKASEVVLGLVFIMEVKVFPAIGRYVILDVNVSQNEKKPGRPKLKKKFK